MQNIQERRLDRARRRAAEACLDLSAVAMLEAAELAHARGYPFALSGIGRVDPFSMLVKP